MEEEIIPADKKLRLWTILAVIAVAIAGLFILKLLHSNVTAIEKASDDDLEAAVDNLVRLVKIVAWTGGLAFVGTGAWFWQLGRRINRAGQFPPPGMKVIKDTPARTGPKAQRLAKMALITGVLCVSAGPFFTWHLCRIAVLLLEY